MTDIETVWAGRTLGQLIEKLETTDHQFFRTLFPRIRDLLGRVAARKDHPVGKIAPALLDTLRQFQEELEDHMVFEEDEVFTYIRKLERRASDPTAPPLTEPPHTLARLEYDHAQSTEALLKVRLLTTAYCLPENAGEDVRALYESLHVMEADLTHHMQLENEVLLPRARELERQLRGS